MRTTFAPIVCGFLLALSGCASVPCWHRTLTESDIETIRLAQEQIEGRLGAFVLPKGEAADYLASCGMLDPVTGERVLTDWWRK